GKSPLERSWMNVMLWNPALIGNESTCGGCVQSVLPEAVAPVTLAPEQFTFPLKQSGPWTWPSIMNLKKALAFATAVLRRNVMLPALKLPLNWMAEFPNDVAPERSEHWLWKAVE